LGAERQQVGVGHFGEKLHVHRYSFHSDKRSVSRECVGAPGPVAPQTALKTTPISFATTLNDCRPRNARRDGS
jgi:hypothetical protein